MSKYIDADQIRKEIERLKDTACRRADNRYGREDANTYEAWAGAYEKVLEILDTLPEQVNGPSRDQVGTKFAAEGLEEAAEKSASQYYVDGGYSPFPNVETAAHEAGFIAGAEWQKKLDDLETADLLAIAHLQGMEQQKSKMMEEAVEFECIGKKVKMTIQELINYYIDQECCNVADECGF